MQAVQKRLLHIEDEFISSLADYSPSELPCFESKFRNDIQRAIPFDQANDEIFQLANAIITRSSLVAHQFSLLNQKYQELTESLQNEMEEILDPNALSTSKSHSKPIASIGSSSLPPYIAPAYQWLMDNLHCPYPTVTKKDSLATLSGTGRKAIDAWFIDVRKRIGWSSLRKSRYQGKKKEIIRDATEFFQEGKHVDAALEFASIHGAAKELYSGKLGHSILATRIGALIDRKRETSSTPHSSVTSEDHSSSLHERYGAPTLHHPRRTSSMKTSLSKRSRSPEDWEGPEHDSRSLKRQRVHPGPTHIPVTFCNAAKPSNFEPKSCPPTKSSSTDEIFLVRPEEHIDLGFTDSTTMSSAETSGTPTPCTLTPPNRKRFTSDSGPNETQSKASKSQSVSESLNAQTSEAPPEWGFNPELSHLIVPSCGLSDTAVYDVEAFDFGSFDFGDPLQMSQIVGVDSLEPIPPFLPPTMSTLDKSDNESNQTFVGISDFSLNDPSSIASFDLDGLNLPATLSALTQPPELNISNHKSGSPVGTDQTASWNFGNMDNLFQDILQTPPISSAVSRSCVLREEKRKKLQQLAEMRLAQEQLEAEIATLDSQFS